MNAAQIIPYRKGDRDRVINLALRAWSPVFAVTRGRLPGFVSRAFYPNGWQGRQMHDIGRLLDRAPQNVLLAVADDELVGVVGIRLRAADSLGEIEILAVSPDHQRQDTGRALLEAAETLIRKAGMAVAMIETIDATQSDPAQETYEQFGYHRVPVVRYFKEM